MAKGVKKKGSKFTNRRNKQRYLKKREDKKKLSKSTVKEIKSNWDIRKTARENVADMGLAFDPNEVVSIHQERRKIIDTIPLEGVNFEPPKVARKITGKKKDTEKAGKVVQILEQQSKEEQDAYNTKKNKFQLFQRETELCIYMLAKHGEQFEAMARDPRNLWQYTPKQWAKKIRTHKDSSYYRLLENV